jgi:hypothetical protein
MNSNDKLQPGDIVELISQWHSVPAGTRLIVRYGLKAGMYEPGAYSMAREDGDLLPGPWGDHDTTVIYDKSVKLVERKEG